MTGEASEGRAEGPGGTLAAASVTAASVTAASVTAASVTAASVTAASITAALRTRAYGRSLDLRLETGSTNDDAREAASRGAARGHVVLAEAQTRGRGARGRVWSSPRGTDLYLSIVERIPVEPARMAPLTLAVGLGLADAVQALEPSLAARVKWPNDLWIDGRKVAGVLVEATSIGMKLDSLVIGVGLGVNRLAWEPELTGVASSMLAEVRRAVPGAPPYDRARVLAAVLEHVERWVDLFVAEGPAPVVASLTPRLALLGQDVRCDHVRGRLLGLSPSGALRLETESGIEDILSGTLRPAAD